MKLSQGIVSKLIQTLQSRDVEEFEAEEMPRPYAPFPKYVAEICEFTISIFYNKVSEKHQINVLEYPDSREVIIREEDSYKNLDIKGTYNIIDTKFRKWTEKREQRLENVLKG